MGPVDDDRREFEASYPQDVAVRALVADPTTRLWPLPRVEYERMAEAGVFDDLRVELLEGVVVEMPPIGPEHVWTVVTIADALARRLREEVGERYVVSQRSPYVAGDYSEPEPDILVLERDAFSPHVRVSAARLAIEVAVSSRQCDLVQKPPIYAGGDVTEYWVIDIPKRRLVVHRNPADDHYGEIVTASLDATVSVLGITLPLGEVLRLLLDGPRGGSASATDPA
jgi:Uma2 family endonuclease